jgi:hypothetical protein
MRQYVAWRGLGPNGADTTPRFRIMDTPGNRRVFDQIQAMVTDPDHLEDVLKVDADEYGDGGDDAYDCCRMGLAARPLRGREPPEPLKSAWEPSVLVHEMEQGRRVRNESTKVKRVRNEPLGDDHFGGY